MCCLPGKRPPARRSLLIHLGLTLCSLLLHFLKAAAARSRVTADKRKATLAGGEEARRSGWAGIGRGLRGVRSHRVCVQWPLPARAVAIGSQCCLCPADREDIEAALEAAGLSYRKYQRKKPVKAFINVGGRVHCRLSSQGEKPYSTGFDGLPA